MPHKFAEIVFTPAVRELQRASGSREGYAAMDGGEDYNNRLGEREATFLAARDSFYMASVSQSGWPYVQHRGGPAGFLKVLDDRTIGFADYSGNRQYVSTGNVLHDDRVALFFMDYPNRRRLKMLGRVHIVGIDDEQALAQLEDATYRARIERGFIIEVEAFDWNCPQHITPRFSAAEVEALVENLQAENRDLKIRLTKDNRISHNDEAPRAPSAALPVALGDGPLELEITGVRQLTPRVRAYELRDPSGAQLPPVTAGSHLRVDIPANHFELHGDARPAILIAGGIGITAIKPMAQALEARGANFRLHYVGRNLREMAFRERLQRQLKDRLCVYSSADGERLDIHALLAEAPADAMVYVCGPDRMIDAVVDSARKIGFPADRLRFERFT